MSGSMATPTRTAHRGNTHPETPYRGNAPRGPLPRPYASPGPTPYPTQDRPGERQPGWKTGRQDWTTAPLPESPALDRLLGAATRTLAVAVGALVGALVACRLVGWPMSSGEAGARLLFGLGAVVAVAVTLLVGATLGGLAVWLLACLLVGGAR